MKYEDLKFHEKILNVCYSLIFSPKSVLVKDNSNRIRVGNEYSPILFYLLLSVPTVFLQTLLLPSNFSYIRISSLLLFYMIMRILWFSIIIYITHFAIGSIYITNEDGADSRPHTFAVDAIEVNIILTSIFSLGMVCVWFIYCVLSEQYFIDICKNQLGILPIPARFGEQDAYILYAYGFILILVTLSTIYHFIYMKLLNYNIFCVLVLCCFHFMHTEQLVTMLRLI